ncbi:type II secretion system GspH family protein, partial [Patescibacteria group bacterium]|nr:type II secretion system GspH family protein [Patescibacteria group bacterium]
MTSVKITKLSAGGFTLVEVLAAVGVLAVGSLAFLPAFTNANKERNLQQSVENARDALANARNRAL